MDLAEKQMVKTSLLKTIYTSEPEKDRETGIKLTGYSSRFMCIVWSMSQPKLQKRDYFQSYIIGLKS